MDLGCPRAIPSSWIERAAAADSALWVVPTAAARDLLIGRLPRLGLDPFGHHVVSWADFWEQSRPERGSVPELLPEAALRAVRREITRRAEAEGQLRTLGEVARSAGFQRRLQSRFAAWTREERNPRAGPPEGADAVTRDEWTLYRAYRAALRSLDGEDREGAIVRASKHLGDTTPARIRDAQAVLVLGLRRLDPPTRRALAFLNARAGFLAVGVAIDPDRLDLDEAGWDIREALDAEGFEEEPEGDGPPRPAALGHLARSLFLDDEPPPPYDRTDGLSALVAPEGEPMARAIAGRVRSWLDGGARPEEILVLFRRQGPAIDELRRALGDRDVAVASPAAGSLATDPAVAALLLAMSIPDEEWDAQRLCRLLRNGLVRPELPAIEAPHALATAAATIRDLRVFRDRDRLRTALERQVAADQPGETDDPRKVARARTALAVFHKVASLLAAAARPGTWDEQVARLARLADGLGLDTSGPALDLLFGALDDHGEVLAVLDPDRPWRPWRAFLAEVESLARDLALPAPAPPAGALRILAMDEAAGATTRFLVLADLGEGVFPARDLIAPTLRRPEEFQPAIRREMTLFLTLLGSAAEHVCLAYASSDEKGQELLPAGFVEEIRARFTPRAWAELAEIVPRHGTPGAGGPNELRVRAVARARVDGDPAELARLAASPRHRDALRGTATALRVAQARSAREGFGGFEGMLGDADAIGRIARDFGPGRPAFSPSQLESLAFCPFQFFLRYVLHLDPIDARDELDSDFAARGSRIHRVLEDLHRSLIDNPDPRPADEAVAGRLGGLIEQEIGRDLAEPGGPALGLERIEAEQLRQMGRRYLRQYGRYRQGLGERANSHAFEVRFGRAAKAGDPEYDALRIGEGDEQVTMQGTIDRIDVIGDGHRMFFRVIDYKSGSAPSRGDVDAGIALQLPLYALAVERILLVNQRAEPFDVGYWALSRNGYRAARLMAKFEGDDIVATRDWPTFRDALERFVVELVASLRRGQFPIAPRSDDCTKVCDYRHACRIGQVRALRKTWDEAPRIVLPGDDA